MIVFKKKEHTFFNDKVHFLNRNHRSLVSQNDFCFMRFMPAKIPHIWKNMHTKLLQHRFF